LGRRAGPLRLGLADQQPVAVADLVAGLGRPAVDLDAARLDQPLHGGAAVLAEEGAQVLVQAQAVDLEPGGVLDDLRVGGGAEGVHRRLHGCGRAGGPGRRADAPGSSSLYPAGGPITWAGRTLSTARGLPSAPPRSPAGPAACARPCPGR